MNTCAKLKKNLNVILTYEAKQPFHVRQTGLQVLNVFFFVLSIKNYIDFFLLRTCVARAANVKVSSTATLKQNGPKIGS